MIWKPTKHKVMTCGKCGKPRHKLKLMRVWGRSYQYDWFCLVCIYENRQKKK